MGDKIIVLDYGSQTAQLIARRVRELGVYTELLPWNTASEKVLALRPKGFILSGGPNSVYDSHAPGLPNYLLEMGLPILGICYGMQLLAQNLGGKVDYSNNREFGRAEILHDGKSLLWKNIPNTAKVWMSHSDSISVLPSNFTIIGQTSSIAIAALEHSSNNIYGIQFHPEVSHTECGIQLLSNFAIDICGCSADWTTLSFIDDALIKIREKVGNKKVLLALSGGVDSSVVAALLDRAIGDQLFCVFVDNGLLRKDEAVQVVKVFTEKMKLRLYPVNAVEEFLNELIGVTDPEIKRKLIGETFIRVFQREESILRSEFGKIHFLAQGTIYPDLIESATPDRPGAHKIKTHHNVGGLPSDLQFELIEPLRYLFKDEVRKVGQALGLPDQIVWRQPFPGPGLAIRCLGEVTIERLELLREADFIFLEELANLENDSLGSQISQAFAVLLPVKSVGVMGDRRTYYETIALRSVTTDNFMTADWSRLPSEVLAKISSRIINEVPNISRVVYDITSKPPATIEWE
jgi:GMP synthase (glutamine-hydrolysing)